MLDLAEARAVEVAVHLGPLRERVALGHRLERGRGRRSGIRVRRPRWRAACAWCARPRTGARGGSRSGGASSASSCRRPETSDERNRQRARNARVRRASLDILHLLPHPLDLRLELDDRVGDREVLRLRSDRIYLARHLLQKEIEPPPCGSSLRNEASQVAGVDCQPGELLGDVGSLERGGRPLARAAPDRGQPRNRSPRLAAVLGPRRGARATRLPISTTSGAARRRVRCRRTLRVDRASRRAPLLFAHELEVRRWPPTPRREERLRRRRKSCA